MEGKCFYLAIHICVLLTLLILVFTSLPTINLLPNFMVKLFSYLDSSAKTMIPDLEITMQTDTSYAEELLGLKFNPAKGCISETAKSVVRLGLV